MRTIVSLMSAVLLGCHPIPPPASRANTQAIQATPPSRDCFSDVDCDRDAAKCLSMNRAGELMTGSSKDPEPRYSRCLVRCDDAPCAQEQRCVIRPVMKIGPGRRAVPSSEHYCIPKPRYGAAPLGGRCATDDDCDERAPYCLDAMCASWCPPFSSEVATPKNCPSGYECRPAQRVLKDELQVSDFCVRLRTTE